MYDSIFDFIENANILNQWFPQTFDVFIRTQGFVESQTQILKLFNIFDWHLIINISLCYCHIDAKK